MLVGVQHHIFDPETAVKRGQTLLNGDGAPEDTRVIQFYLGEDQTLANCLWDTGSLIDVTKYVNETLGDAANNHFFVVDSEHSLGLPTAMDLV